MILANSINSEELKEQRKPSKLRNIQEQKEATRGTKIFTALKQLSVIRYITVPDIVAPTDLGSFSGGAVYEILQVIVSEVPLLNTPPLAVRCVIVRRPDSFVTHN